MLIEYNGAMLERDGELAASQDCCCLECNCDNKNDIMVTLRYVQGSDTKTEEFAASWDETAGHWTTGAVGTAIPCPDGGTQVTDFARVELTCNDAEGDDAFTFTLYELLNAIGESSVVSVPVCPQGAQAPLSPFDAYTNGACSFTVDIVAWSQT